MKQEQQAATPSGPIGYESKANNVLGTLGMWSAHLPIMHFVVFILGLFTVPAEVFFRKNFGERWLTTVNFYAGLLVLTIFTMIQAVGTAIGSHPTYYYNNRQTQPTDQPSFFDSLMDKSLLIILLAYVLLSSYHFFKLWWRNRTNTPEHSFSDGVSRFEPIGNYLMLIVNAIAVPVIKIYMRLLPKNEQQPNMPVPPLLEDVTVFTNTVVEPFVLLLLFIFCHGTLATFLLISGTALAVYSNWKETAKLDRFLDFRDTAIEAEDAKIRRSQEALQQAHSTQNLIMNQMAQKIEKQPDIAAQIAPSYPDLMSVIEEMNSNQKNKTTSDLSLFD